MNSAFKAMIELNPNTKYDWLIVVLKNKKGEYTHFGAIFNKTLAEANKVLKPFIIMHSLENHLISTIPNLDSRLYNNLSEGLKNNEHYKNREDFIMRL
jgi:hypothetical protein